MTAAVRELIASFESLSESDRREAAVEILRRIGRDDGLTDEVLVEAADALFCSLDAEEAASDAT